MFQNSILWINARNLLYIKKFNPRKSIRLADNKLKTKKFLMERWIPVPKTYWVIKSRKEIYDFDFMSIPEWEFVIKPNKWSWGKWVDVVKIVDNDKNIWFSPKKFFVKSKKWNLEEEKKLFKIKDTLFDRHSFNRYLSDIVDWKYSLTFWQDKIIVEERIKPSEKFKKYCKHGLADIRIISFNLIPVAGMIRYPTYASGSKANLSQWGIGLWIEVWSGRIKSMYYKKQIFDKEFPGELKEFYNKKVPFREDLMFLSSRIQYFENLGFLWLDWVISEEGPKILEINSRSWLEVQNASLLPLRRRLEKIGNTKVKDPEKWVEIAKSLFTSIKTNISLWKVLYLSQKANIIFESPEKDEKVPITVEIDLKKEKNLISKDLYKKIKNYDKGDIIIDIYENEIRFKNLMLTPSDKITKNTIVLCHTTVSDYYIKPIKKIHPTVNVINNENIIHEEIEKLINTDQTLSQLSKKLNLSYIFKPINYLDELDNFILWNGNYNPKFKYKRPSDEKLEEIRDQLLILQEKNFAKDIWLKSKFSEIFSEKIEELILRYHLIKAYKYQKYKDILKYNELLYGWIDKELLKLSKQKLFLEEENEEKLLWKILTPTKTKNIIKQHLKKLGIYWVKVISNPWNLARISIYRGKNCEIRISNLARFREKELRSVIAHEIDTHLLRFINWKNSGWEILKSWTWFYIKDEEWIAVYQSYQQLPKWYERKWIYEKYHFTKQAQKYEFSRLVDLIRGIKDIPLNRAFNWALRYKRGIVNTWFINPGSVNFKNKIYLEWYLNIKERVENWWDLDKLFIWKIKIKDLDYI